MRKPLIILLIIVFLNSSIAPVYPYSQMLDFLYEIGIKFYLQGRYDEALHELRKALIVQPNYEPALEYIRRIEQMEVAPAPVPPKVAPPQIPEKRLIKEKRIPYAYSEIPNALCELGIKFYQQGRYAEALHELRKALIVQPNYEPALEYIRMIEQREVAPPPAPMPVPVAPVPHIPAPPVEVVPLPAPVAPAVSEVQSLKDKITKLRRKAMELSEALKLKEDEIVRLKQEGMSLKDSLTAQLQEANTKLDTISRANNLLEKQIEELGLSRESLEKDLNNIKEQLLKKDQANASLLEDINSLKQALEKKEKEYLALKQEKEMLQSRLQTTETEFKNLRARYKDLDTELNLLKQQLPAPVPPVVPKVEKKERVVPPPVEAKKEELARQKEERLKQQALLEAIKEAELKAKEELKKVEVVPPAVVPVPPVLVRPEVEKVEVVPLPAPAVVPKVEKKERVVPPPVEAKKEELARQKEERLKQQALLEAIKEAELKAKEELKKVEVVSAPPEIEAVPEKIAPPEILTLDESLDKILQPIEIEQGKSIMVVGKNIQRFLATQPDILSVEKKSADELLVTGKNIGYTYLHIWDDNGRWTIEFLGMPLKPPGPTYEETMRREEERARNFKLSYALTWSSFETGRGIKSLKRSSYSWGHNLGLLGDTPTPYGKVSSSASIRSSKTTTDLTYLNLNLTDGKIGPFKGFTLRGFDYSVPFSNLAVSGAGLRGAMLTSPAFNKKLDYTVFWGREGGGRYGNLSPGLIKIKHSFLEGFNMNYLPTKEESYKFSLAHGWGRDRPDYLTPYTYDITSGWGFDKWGLGYDIAFDSETFAHRLNTSYTQPKLNFTTEVRNISKNFYNIAGKGWRAGELGTLFNVNYKPTEKLNMNSRLDVYQDRLFSPPEKKDYWDESFDWGSNYRIDPSTSLSLNYSLQNRLGGISKSRSQNTGLGVSKKIKFIKDISTYANYRHQDNENFSSPASSYINDKVYMGLRFSLIGALSYYFNKEMNWLLDTYTDTRARPNAYETGLDWSSQLGRTPLYGSFRFAFRDEEDAESTLSFLSGEDYIDGSVELSYRPDPNKEIYGSCQMRNVWAEKEGTAKHIDLNFNAGMRYLWDTGIHFESVGNIEGYVFKDLNYDGLRQRDEAPVEGIKLWLGKKKSEVTDIFGYYKFKKVKAAKAYITLDTTTLPSGFVLTVPLTQEVAIAHKRSVEVDFGIISRSEIGGLVFEDVNGDGEYDRNDKGVGGVVITLEDGSQAITDGLGRYSFPHVSTGEHTLTLDLNSLPVYYLPQTALTKKITLFEGVSYIHNIPLKRIQE